MVSRSRTGLQIAPTKSATFKTEFIATIAPDETKEPQQIGVIVATESGENPAYTMKGNELYVRAVVTSSLPAVDPSFKGQKQQAWSQPVGWADRGE